MPSARNVSRPFGAFSAQHLVPVDRKRLPECAPLLRIRREFLCRRQETAAMDAVFSLDQKPPAIQVAEAMVMAADTAHSAKPIFRICCIRCAWSSACLACAPLDTGPLSQRCGTHCSSVNESLSLPSNVGSLDRSFISHLGSGFVEQRITSRLDLRSSPTLPVLLPPFGGSPNLHPRLVLPFVYTVRPPFKRTMCVDTSM